MSGAPREAIHRLRPIRRGAVACDQVLTVDADLHGIAGQRGPPGVESSRTACGESRRHQSGPPRIAREAPRPRASRAVRHQQNLGVDTVCGKSEFRPARVDGYGCVKNRACERKNFESRAWEGFERCSSSPPRPSPRRGIGLYTTENSAGIRS